jgi:hypothetical protein
VLNVERAMNIDEALCHAINFVIQTCVLAEQDTEAEAIYAKRKEALHRELK